MKIKTVLFCAAGTLLLGALALGLFGKEDPDQDFPVLTHLSTPPTLSVSTIPANGDVNPYGVAFVPQGFPAGGPLSFGDILVSNFNDSANAQGSGTTIVRISANGQQSLFFQGHQGLGLTTALGVLRTGFVIVGSVPSAGGRGACTQVGTDETGVKQGSLLILDRNGRVVRTLTSEQFLDGPWDLTLRDNGSTAAIFVSSVLSGTVTRLDVATTQTDVVVLKETQIASGYLHRCDPNAFVVGPTGLALQPNTDALYVASAGDNEIFKIANASTRTTDARQGQLFINDPMHLHGPLGLGLAPNGDLILAEGDAVNTDPNHVSELSEYSPAGTFIAQFQIDPSIGSAFGLAIMPLGDGFRFAAVDDGNNILDVWNVF